MGSRLFVGNLSWDTTEASLRAAFEGTGGTVKDAHIVTDRETGRSRGFAFVEMQSAQEAEDAIAQLDGMELDGRTIRVNEAQERQQRGGGGPRSAGGGGGRTRDRGGFDSQGGGGHGAPRESRSNWDDDDRRERERERRRDRERDRERDRDRW